MKKLLVLYFLLALIVFQYSSFQVSAKDSSSYVKQLKQQQHSLKEFSSKKSFFKQDTKLGEFKKLAEGDVLFESEPNDYPAIADQLPFDYTMIGKFLTYEDLDFYSIPVTSSGTLLLAGTTSDGAWIDLVYGVFDKDGNIIKPFDFYEEDGVYVLSYQLTPGTYYAVAAEYDGLASAYDQYALLGIFLTEDATPPAKPVLNKIDDNDKALTGKTEAGSTVYVYRGKTFLQSAVTNSKGAFSVKLPAQKAGTILVAYAEDDWGNVSTAATIEVIDKTPPSAPKVNPLDDNDIYIKGKTEAYATVSIKKGTSLIGTAKATSKGDFSVKIKPVAAKSTLTITAKDKDNNISKATALVVKDKTPPKVSKLSPVDNNDLYVKGKTEPGAIVTVKVGTKKASSGKANSKGDFSIRIKAQKTNTVLSIYVKDASNNSSKAYTVKVTKAR